MTGPGRARGGPPGSARPSVNLPSTKRLRPARQGTAAGQHPEPGRVTGAAWAAAVGRVPLTAGGRLVVGQLADRARDGRVRVTPGALAASCCLRVTEVSDVLADLASRGLLAQDGLELVLTRPGVAR